MESEIVTLEEEKKKLEKDYNKLAKEYIKTKDSFHTKLTSIGDEIKAKNARIKELKPPIETNH
jgi:predicted  nucleic acid-binding Zn-ribbon protein